MEGEIGVSIFTEIFLLTSTGPSFILILIAILVVLLLLLASALISGSEVAFFSLSPDDLKTLKDEESKQSDRILSLLSRPRKLLATILISNNFINIGIVIVSDYVLRHTIPEETLWNWAGVLKSSFPFYQIGLNEGWIHDFLSIIITVVGATFLLVLFGEVAPKIYAKVYNLELSRRMSGILFQLEKFLMPFSNILVSGTNLIERKLERKSGMSNLTSKEDIDQAIELTLIEGKHAKEDADILKGIVKFGDVSVKQIMRSRLDVVAIDFRTKFTELLKVVRESGYSRIPVYDEELDNITGILYVKDLLGFLNETDSFEWQALIRPKVIYVPEAKKIDQLLKDFQSKRQHMAIVVDEYGGSAGIVTLEDIMEEIIGEIHDEFDEEEEVDYIKLDSNNYIFEGKTLLNDVCKIIGVDTTTFDEIRGDADSVAGLMLEITGIMPKKDKEVMYQGFRLKAISVNKRRIEQIKITILND